MSSLGSEKSNLEIERKFLVKYLPAGLEDGIEITQGYLASDDGSELRVRQKSDKYYKTSKIGFGLERQEDETEITKAEFDHYWLEVDKKISKTRYEIPLSGAVLELDQYHGELEGHLIAEVELLSADQTIDLSNLPWIAEEVTGKREYSNFQLAHNGWPRE